VKELDRALEQLSKMRGLVLDVRHVYLCNRAVVRPMLDRLTQEGLPGAYTGPLVVLLNEWGAKEAQELAMAVESLGRAKVIRTETTDRDYDFGSVSDPLLAEVRAELLRQGSRLLPDS
jgi:hypothetical protein